MHNIKDPEKFLEQEYHRLIDHVSQLPHKILEHHHVDSLVEMILHEIGHDKGFGLKRAIYLVDNPDFDHLVGAAGFCKGECKFHKSDIWHAPHTFSHDMKDAEFHNNVKKFFKNSLKRKDVNLEDARDIQELAKVTGVNDPQFFSWNMKHGNHGILIFDQEGELSPKKRNLLNNSVALLSLCSIF